MEMFLNIYCALRRAAIDNNSSFPDPRKLFFADVSHVVIQPSCCSTETVVMELRQTDAFKPWELTNLMKRMRYSRLRETLCEKQH